MVDAYLWLYHTDLWDEFYNTLSPIKKDIYGQVLDKYRFLFLESRMASDYDSIYDKAFQRRCGAIR